MDVMHEVHIEEDKMEVIMYGNVDEVMDEEQ